jgi:sugar phosphate isomerase/epimerase
MHPGTQHMLPPVTHTSTMTPASSSSLNRANQRESSKTSRRNFLAAGAAGLAAFTSSCAHRTAGTPRPKIAFNTANLVARYSGYRFELKHWGEQHQLTVARTDEKAWAAICREIADCGFSAIEIWEAHAAPQSLNQARANTWKRILADHGLQPVAYAGGLSPETTRICQWLGIPHIDGGLRGLQPDAATTLCQSSGIRFNLENHPEKTVAEILAPIGGGNEWLGVCVDTGWLGTQGADVPAVIRALGPLVRHTHIKDVKAPGAHETCPLGQGVVNVEASLRALQGIGYRGWYSWEDEPEDRNPFQIAAAMRRWLEAQLSTQ